MPTKYETIMIVGIVIVIAFVINGCQRMAVSFDKETTKQLQIKLEIEQLKYGTKPTNHPNENL